MFLLYICFGEEITKTPHSDKFLMYAMSLFNLSLIILSLLIILLLNQNETLFYVNFLVLILYIFYNTYFYYQLRHSSGGSGLIWVFIILFANGFHFLGTLIYLIRFFRKKIN